MKLFAGFPSRGNFTPLPNVFFSSLLPEINDIVELKITLLVFEILYPKKGYPKYVTGDELLNNITVRQCFQKSDTTAAKLLKDVLGVIVARGTLLHLSMKGGKSEDFYLLNNEENRQVIERVRNGELQLAGLTSKMEVAPQPVQVPDIYTIYEENIGMLTPLIAEELKDAEKNYPEDWIRDAVKESVALNKRNWRYISRILERWSTEGKKDGTHQRHTKENTDPDKYIKGKYGHIVQR